METFRRLYDWSERTFWNSLTKKLMSFLLLLLIDIVYLGVYLRQKGDIEARLRAGNMPADVLQGIVAGFAMLALIASVFGIINTQYISVLERTSQIGLMKALGMPRSGVAKLFRYEAAWIGFLGGVLGAATAVAVGLAMNPWISEKLSLGEHRLLLFVWWHILILIASLVIVAIVAGWLPARKAAKLDPIEALRTE